LEAMVTPSRVSSLIVTRADGTEDEVIANSVGVGDLNRTFVMATNMFTFTGGDDYVSLAAGTLLGETDVGEQDILENYITGVLGGTVDLVDPPPSPRIDGGGECLTMSQLAVQTPDFSTLLATIQAAGLTNTLDTLGFDEPLTIFAPSNAAFDNLPPGILDGILQDLETLPSVLGYHVIFGAAYTADFVDGQVLQTLYGLTLTVSVSGDTVMVNDATIILPDVIACDGVVHGIDKPLLPASLVALPTEAPVSPPIAGVDVTPAPAPSSDVSDISTPSVYTFVAAIVASSGVWMF
jgi:uncharacterized surface protein with fasciclin (FAS1) repeats